MMSLASHEIRTWAASSDVHVVTASGELDLNAAPDLRETLLQLTDLRRLDLIIDMSDATFIDSTVIGVLMGRLKALRAAGGSLALVCQNEMVMRTFSITGLERVVAIHRTLSEALAAEQVVA